MNAKQIVNRMLEWGIYPDAPRPGSSEDPWRQSLGAPGGMTFAPRPGETAPPEEIDPENEIVPGDLLDAPPEEDKPTPIPIKHKPVVNPRFRWRPPTPPGP